MEGGMGALDDVSEGVMFTNLPNEFVIACGRTFCEEDVIGAADVVHRFAKGSSREEVPVSKRCLRVHEAHLDAATEREVLHPIIEEQGVRFEDLDRGGSCASAIPIGEHDHVSEGFGEHVRFIASEAAIEEEGVSVVNDPREGWRYIAPTILPSSEYGRFS